MSDINGFSVIIGDIEQGNIVKVISTDSRYNYSLKVDYCIVIASDYDIGGIDFFTIGEDNVCVKKPVEEIAHELDSLIKNNQNFLIIDNAIEEVTNHNNYIN